MTHADRAHAGARRVGAVQIEDNLGLVVLNGELAWLHLLRMKERNYDILKKKKKKRKRKIEKKKKEKKPGN